MDDAVLVGLGQAFGDFGRDPDRLARLHGPAPEPVLQAFALITGHDDVEAAVLGLVDFVDCADVRMVEARRRPGLVDETLPGFGVRCQSGRQELEGDRPLEAEVLGLVDDAHAAPAELADDAVLAGHGLSGLDLGGGNFQCPGRDIPHFSLRSADGKNINSGVRSQIKIFGCGLTDAGR